MPRRNNVEKFGKRAAGALAGAVCVLFSDLRLGLGLEFGMFSANDVSGTNLDPLLNSLLSTMFLALVLMLVLLLSMLLPFDFFSSFDFDSHPFDDFPKAPCQDLDLVKTRWPISTSGCVCAVPIDGDDLRTWTQTLTLTS
jgi:hypothetical protein